MKKIVLYVFSILLGLFCLGGGTFLFTADTQLPQQEEEAEAEYTITFYRAYDAYSSTVYVSNCTKNYNYSISKPSSSTASDTTQAITYSASDVLRISIARLSSYNYEFITDGCVGGEGASTFTFVNEVFFLGSNLTSYSRILFYSTGKYSNYRITYDANGGSFVYGQGGAINGNNRRYSSGVIAKFGDRTYTKKSSGYAYVGWAHRLHRWAWPVLVSTSASTVQYYSSYDTSGTVSSAGSFTYNGSTYYYSGMGYEYQSQFNTYTSLTIPYIDTCELLYAGNSYGSSFDLHKLIAQKTVENAATKAVLWTSGSSYVFPSIKPYKAGYTCTGWSTSSSGSVNVTSSSTTSYNRTLYAVWKENSYDFVFYPPDMTYGEEYYTVSATETFTFPEGYCQMGYHVEYWEDDYNYMSWDPGYQATGFSIIQDIGCDDYDATTIYFYGCDEPNVYYLEFYDDSGGGSDGPVVSATTNYSRTYTVPTEADIGNRWGYYLDGWESSNYFDCEPGESISVAELAYNEDYEYVNGAYITLYAQWGEDPKTSVTLSKGTGISSVSFSADYDGRTGYISGQTSSSSVYSGSSVTCTASVASGYSFDGWYNGTTRVSTSSTYTITPTSATTLTVKATPVYATINVKLALEGGATWPSGVSASARVNYTNGNGVSTYTTVNG
ncbi:MAG: InlB B-repeat-containing protein, partial [Clostridia bacterium]|nr:InlB B-repeat-containing protein [Clostridia bacterium]